MESSNTHISPDYYRITLAISIAFFLYILLLRVNNLKQQYTAPQHDLRAYLACAHNIVDGRHIYKTHHKYIPGDPTLSTHIPKYIYPPLMGMILIPFNSIPYTTFKKYWFFLNLFLIFHAILLSVTLLGFKQFRWPVFFAISAVMIGSDPVRLLLYTAQADALAIYLSLLALYFFNKQKWLPAAILIAVASWTKVTPGIFFIYFLTRGNLKFTIYALSSAIILMMLQLGAVGKSQFLYFFTDIAKEMPETLPAPSMESLWSLFSLIFIPHEQYYILNKPHLLVPFVVTFKLITMAIITIPMLRTGSKKESLFMGFAILSSASLLITDISWMMRFVWNLVTIAALFYISGNIKTRITAYLTLALTVMLLLLNNTYLWMYAFKGDLSGWRGIITGGVAVHAFISLLIITPYYLKGSTFSLPVIKTIKLYKSTKKILIKNVPEK
ncbi:MAG: DUF2029 domain-containing protein [Deltaproteobacteria bacterium]|nr:DUF2029 domain-containing protein [Deltaproteobacteria bacterium]